MGSDEAEDMLPHKEMGQLSFEEKKFLLAVERGDVATVRRWHTCNIYDLKLYKQYTNVIITNIYVIKTFASRKSVDWNE